MGSFVWIFLIFETCLGSFGEADLIDFGEIFPKEKGLEAVFGRSLFVTTKSPGVDSDGSLMVQEAEKQVFCGSCHPLRHVPNPFAIQNIKGQGSSLRLLRTFLKPTIAPVWYVTSNY